MIITNTRFCAAIVETFHCAWVTSQGHFCDDSCLDGYSRYFPVSKDRGDHLRIFSSTQLSLHLTITVIFLLFSIKEISRRRQWASANYVSRRQDMPP